ncbi:MAG: putative metal-binding motif-containing protein, partial [Myxococcales bacterium]|nr:putative metal-binding motif-containing protein [Myxococcales bacterium]
GCVNTPVDAACDDGVECTVDRCDATAGCSRTPDDSLCDDGVCFTGGTCDATRGCMGAREVNCSDGNPCTTDSCVAGEGCRNVETDGDMDGFALSAMGRCGGDDCDDSNAAIYPGATELCNATDDDCDGRVDEDPSCASDLPDDCDSATAITLVANAGSITGSFEDLNDDYDTLCETSTGSRSAIGGTSRGASPDAIHYIDLPTGTWDVRIDTEGASVDTVLAASTSCGDFELGGLGCNDDANLGVSTFSRIWLHRAGSGFSTTRIYLLVEPYGTSASGDYTINVSVTSAAADRCGAALDIRGGGTVIGFAAVASGAAGGARGSCQSDGSFLEGEHLFFYGPASRENPAVFEIYARTHTPDVYTRFVCNDSDTEGECATSSNIGGGLNRARIQVNGGNFVFADGLTGSGNVYSLYYDP